MSNLKNKLIKKKHFAVKISPFFLFLLRHKKTFAFDKLVAMHRKLDIIYDLYFISIDLLHEKEICTLGTRCVARAEYKTIKTHLGLSQL